MKRLKTLLLCLILSVATITTLAVDAQEEEKPRYGGTFLAPPRASDPPTFNPLMTSDNAVHIFGALLYNSLLWVTPDFQIMPNLAESWTAAPDGMSLTFTLVRNATWHDGKPFTSADVKFTVEKMWLNFTVCPYGPAMFSNVANVSTPDEYTATINMKKPYAPLLVYLGTTQYSAILPKHLYEDGDILKNPRNLNNPVGTGPFMFAEWKKGEYTRFVRNPNYFKAGKPYLDEVIVRVIADPVASMAALEKGEIDALEHGPTQYMTLKDNPKFAIFNNYHIASATMGIVEISMERPIVGGYDERGIKVRQALFHTINKTAVNELLYFNLAVIATSHIPGTISFAYKPGLPQYDYDLARANQLLDEAGYPRGSDGVRFELYSPYGAASSPFHELWGQSLKEVGIRLKTEGMDYGSWLKKWAAREYDVLWTTPYHGPDPSVTTGRFYISTNIRPAPYTNNMGYNNSRVDELFFAAQTEVNPDERKTAFWEIQDILWRELPLLPILEISPTLMASVNKDFAGWPDSPFGPAQSLENVWWREGSAYSPEEASSAVSAAEKQINDLAAQFYDVAKCRETLQRAKDALQAKDWGSAYSLAKQAAGLGTPPYWLYGSAVVAVVAIVAVAIWFSRRRRPGF